MSEQDRGGEFLLGFIFGGLVGAVLALLFAPQSGERTREQIKEAGIELQDRALELTDEMRKRAEEFSEEAQRQAGELSKEFSKATEEWSERLDEYVAEGRKRAGDAIVEGKQAAGRTVDAAKSKIDNMASDVQDVRGQHFHGQPDRLSAANDGALSKGRQRLRVRLGGNLGQRH